MKDNYFGVMLDCSRNAVMKPEKVKEFATILKSFGYNMLMLYTEDTYEVDGEPYFGYLRGKYTKEEMKDINDYCNSIGVEVIPCIQTLAHLNAIFRWGDYRTINDTTDILLTEDKRTYKLIDNMFKTLSECFTSRNIHIGMDEAHMLGLGKYLDLHGYKNRFDILLNHLKKVCEIAQKYGFKPMMWSDMFFRLATHGEYYGKGIEITEEVRNKTPKEVGLVFWDYYHTEKDMYDEMIKSHKQFNNEIWFAGGAWSWNGFAPGNEFTMQTMIPAMQSVKEYGIKNVFLTMWGDNGKETSYYSVLPSLYALKKIYDGEEDMNVIKAEFNALTGENFDNMMGLDLPNFVGKSKSIFANVSKAMLYSDPFLGFNDSANVKGVGKDFKKNAEILADMAKSSKNYGYIFDSEAKLCSVMELKYSLGVKIRNAYTDGNKDALKKCVNDIKKIEKRLDEFYKAFKKLWMTENKPHGFDVQDIRIGGLKQRLLSCKERIEEYLKGEIDSIPELEETILDVAGNVDKKKKFIVGGNQWLGLVSPNVM